MGNPLQPSAAKDCTPSSGVAANAQGDRASAQRTHEKKAAVPQGEAPFMAAVYQHDSTEASIAARRARVYREVNDAMARFNQASRK